MEKPTCSSCAFFRQHYGLGDTRIYRLYCGHCVKGRIGRKLPDQKACERYVPAPKPADTFVSREYLSRALLNYMTSLDLLPEIRDWQDLDEKNP